MCDVEIRKKSDRWIDFLMTAASAFLIWDALTTLMRPRKGIDRG